MNWQKYWSSNSTNKLSIVLFVIYLIALFWILLFKLGVQFSYMEKRSVNLIPFSDGKLDIGEVILNVVICVPLGIYAGVLFNQRTFITKLFFFFLISLMFEVLQFSLKVGAFDTTDIITNSIGGVIGLLMFIAIENFFKNSIKAQKFVNIIATIGTLLMISLLFLLKMNMLPVRYQ
jgi:glycopeptide antibiotics resistance protein